ncbi:MAG TPA: FAD-binding oxidoreductase, partial [Nitrolancea sp.]|nr:FAD-binding oxidoreductase [Nitrolancea sp.]
MTVTTSQASEVIDPVLTRAFETRLLGSLVRPNDPEYDEARQIINMFHDRYPAYIVRAADAADVIRAVEFARENELPVTVRSGGHSIPGHSMADGAVVVDMSGMKAVSVDPVNRTLWAQPGATTADVLAATQPHGLALSTGDTASVGLGGLTTGGGIGFLARKYGLTIDSLRSAEIVTADGRLLTASATQNADLFWAIRGGSGNFGIITSFEFDLQPVGMILGGALVLPVTREVLRGYADYTTTAPDELTTIANVMSAPPMPNIPAEWHFKPVFIILVAYAGDPEEGQRVVEPLRKLAEPIAELLMPMPYAGLYQFTAEGAKRHHGTVKSGFMDGLSDAAIDAIVTNAETGFDPFGMVQIRGLGGALARVPNQATAFAHRDKSIFLALINTGAGAENRQWVETLWSELRPFASGVYVNFLGDEGEERVHEAYPPMTYARLAGVKLRYDPLNIFNLNQNIPPAGAPKDARRAGRFARIVKSLVP